MVLLGIICLALNVLLRQLHRVWRAVFYCQNSGTTQYSDEQENFVIFFPDIASAPRMPRALSSVPSEALSYSTRNSSRSARSPSRDPPNSRVKPEPQSSDDSDDESRDEQPVAGPSRFVPLDQDLRNMTPVPDQGVHGHTGGFYRHPDGIIEIQIHRIRGRMHPIPQG